MNPEELMKQGFRWTGNRDVDDQMADLILNTVCELRVHAVECLMTGQITADDYQQKVHCLNMIEEAVEQRPLVILSDEAM